MGRRHVDAPVLVVEEQHDVVRERHAVESENSGIEVEANLQLLSLPPVAGDDQQEFATEEAEGAVQPGAFRVGGNHVSDDATAQDTIWGGIHSAGTEEAAGHDNNRDDPEDDLFSAQLVDPEAERLQMERQLERMLHERLAEQGIEPDAKGTFCAGRVVCGIDFSRRTNQVFCLVVLALAIASLLATLFATDVVGPQSPAAVTSSSGSNPSDVSGRPSRSPIALSPFQAPAATISPIVRPTPGPITNSPMTPALDTLSSVTPTPIRGNPTMLAPVTPIPTLQPSPLPTPAPSPHPVTLAPSQVPATVSPTVVPTPRPVTGAPVAPSISIRPSGRVQWVQVGNDIGAEAPDDRSGRSVALSLNGTVLAIGAPHNDGGGLSAGHVRVHVNTGGGWEQRGSDLDGSAEFDEFGRAVALSADGTILAVGARVANGVNAPSTAIGASPMSPPVPPSPGFPGCSVCGPGLVVTNPMVVVSIPTQPPTTCINFQRAGLLGFIEPLFCPLVPGFTAGCGCSPGTFAPTVSPPVSPPPSSGRVQVYGWISDAWQPFGSTIVGEAAGDSLGVSVALSDDGTILAVGASENGRIFAGRGRVYAWTGTEWDQRGGDLNGSSTGDWFGDSVSLSSDGSVLACGGPQTNNDGPGYVRVYRWNGSTWSQIGSTLFGFSPNDDFGESVSLSGDGRVLGIGADNGGYAVVFQNDGNDWVQIGQRIDSKVSGQRFGFSLSMSFDGSTVVIGGYWNDSNGTGSGHAQVFRFSPTGQEWIQVGQELVGEATNDWFGYSTSISGDGTRIAVGAPLNDGNGGDAGHVQVYDLQ